MRWKGTRLNKHHHGERVHTAKLCADDVRLIDALLRDEQLSLNTIATKFGVSRSVIWEIKHGYIWKHIVGTET